MNDLQKKLDKLIALRELLVHAIANSDLSQLYSLKDASNYNSKIQIITNNYRSQIITNTNNVNKERHLLNNKNQQLNNRSQQLKSRSQQLEQTSQQLNNRSQQLKIRSQQLSEESKQKFNESKQLSKESKRLDKERHRLEKEKQQLTSTINFKDNTDLIVRTNINSLEAVIKEINSKIELDQFMLTYSIHLDNIKNLCASSIFQQKFFNVYLLQGSKLNLLANSTLVPIGNKIRNLSSWQYAGLLINPPSKEWIDCMVAADPLYLMGNNINTLIDSYPIEYIRRLRLYDIQNQDFSVLPQQQFGCIACCNFLNSTDLPTIKNYLSTLLNLLRPGGALVWNFQFMFKEQADILLIIRLPPNITYIPVTEFGLDTKSQWAYAIKLIIHNLFKNSGYIDITVSELSLNEATSLSIFVIEAHKPGVLTTTKAHQVLGSIIAK